MGLWSVGAKNKLKIFIWVIFLGDKLLFWVQILIGVFNLVLSYGLSTIYLIMKWVGKKSKLPLLHWGTICQWNGQHSI